MRHRITLRGEGIELRGYIDGEISAVGRFATHVEPFGVVVASPVADDWDPWPISEPEHPPTIEASFDIVNGRAQAAPDGMAFVHDMAGLHYMQAMIIRGERGRAEQAERELTKRELHHFETEQKLEAALAAARRGDLLGVIEVLET